MQLMKLYTGRVDQTHSGDQEFQHNTPSLPFPPLYLSLPIPTILPPTFVLLIHARYYTRYFSCF